MEGTCRICMGKPEALVNIFDGTPPQSEARLADMISQYTGFFAYKGDSRPETICWPCLQDVQSAFEMKQTYQESQEYQDGPPQMEYFTITEFKNESDEEEIQNFDPDVQNEGIDGDLRQKVGPQDGHNDIQVKNEPINEDPVEEEHYEVTQSELKIEEIEYTETKVNRKDNIEGDLSKKGRTVYEPIYKCSKCAKIFSDFNKLKKHIFYHNTEKAYKCSECPKSFLSPSNLKSHVRTHTGERPYKCSQCPKSYTQVSALNTHYLRHTGELPHRCPHCPRTFLTSPSFKLHVLSHKNKS